MGAPTLPAEDEREPILDGRPERPDVGLQGVVARDARHDPPGTVRRHAEGVALALHHQHGAGDGLQLVVPDIEAARDALTARGVDCGEVQRFPWGSFVFFADPDGNRWAVQEIPARG